MTKTKTIGLAAAASLIVLAALIWPEVPQWRAGGTQSMPAHSVSFVGSLPDCPGAGKRIAVFGDSHVAGSRMGAEVGERFGEVLERELTGRVQVVLYGNGGDTAAMGEERWRGIASARADLVVLAYGTNDAAPRGWLGGRSAVPLERYRASLGRQVTAWERRGSEVILLAPPPGGSAAIAARLAPYREAARDVGRAQGVAVLDPVDAFASCPAEQPVLGRDALHMNAAGHRCLGTWLAQRLCPRTP